MAKTNYEEIQTLIDETWRRIETSQRMVCRATKLVEQSRRMSCAYQGKDAVRVHAECTERAFLLSQISDFSCIGRLCDAFRANGIAAAIHFDPGRGVEIRLEEIDRRTFECLVVQVPLELI